MKRHLSMCWCVRDSVLYVLYLLSAMGCRQYHIGSYQGSTALNLSISVLEGNKVWKPVRGCRGSPDDQVPRSRSKRRGGGAGLEPRQKDHSQPAEIHCKRSVVFVVVALYRHSVNGFLQRSLYCIVLEKQFAFSKSQTPLLLRIIPLIKRRRKPKRMCSSEIEMEPIDRSLLAFSHLFHLFGKRSVGLSIIPIVLWVPLWVWHLLCMKYYRTTWFGFKML